MIYFMIVAIWLVLGFLTIALGIKIGLYEDIKVYGEYGATGIGVISLTIFIWPYVLLCVAICFMIAFLEKEKNDEKK